MNDYAESGRSSPASFGGVQTSHGGSGAGFGRGNVGDKVRPILSLDIDRKHG